MNITTIGVDLAKSIFQVHGIDKRGKVVVQKQLRRSKVLEFFIQLPPCLIVGIQGPGHLGSGLCIMIPNNAADS